VKYIQRRERRTQRDAEELAIENGKSRIESGIHSAQRKENAETRRGVGNRKWKIESGIHSSQRKENAVFRGGVTKLTPSPSLEREGCPA